MAKTVVVNNKEGMIIGQLPHSEKNSAGVRTPGDIVVLLPGANLIDSEVLAILRRNPGFEQYFTLSIPPSAAPEHNPERTGKPFLEVLCEGVDDKAPLAKMKPEHMLTLIKETLTNEPLDLWLKQEKRPEVREMLENQRSKNNGNPAPRGASAGA